MFNKMQVRQQNTTPAVLSLANQRQILVNKASSLMINYY